MEMGQQWPILQSMPLKIQTIWNTTPCQHANWPKMVLHERYSVPMLQRNNAHPCVYLIPAVACWVKLLISIRYAQCYITGSTSFLCSERICELHTFCHRLQEHEAH